MNTEERLRELLNAEPEEWPSADWRAARARARRGTVLRAATTLALIGVLIGGGVALAPHLASKNNSFVQPRGSNDIVVPSAALRYRVPAGWTIKAETPGSYYTVSAPKNGEGTPPFEVGILFDQPRDYHDLVAFTESVGFARVRSGGVTVSPFTPVKVAGLDARQVTLTFPDRDRPAGLPKQDIWCRACVHTVTFVDWPRQSVLLIRVNGSASHSSEVPEMTSDVLSHVEFLDPNELMTPHGLVVMPVNTSDATRALVQFLEARVAGSGAEQYLSPGVAKSYKVTNRNGGLYEAQAERYVSYQVLSFNGTGFQISIVAKVKLSGTTFDFVVDEMIQIGKLPNGSLGVVARDLQLDGH